MHHVTDELFANIESESSGQIYAVMLCIYSADNRNNQPYLSCNCASWTTGKWNKGKEIHERRCKHTDRAKLDNAARWNDICMRYRYSAGRFVTTSVETPIAQAAGNGLVRKIRK